MTSVHGNVLKSGRKIRTYDDSEAFLLYKRLIFLRLSLLSRSSPRATAMLEGTFFVSLSPIMLGECRMGRLIIGRQVQCAEQPTLAGTSVSVVQHQNAHLIVQGGIEGALRQFSAAQFAQALAEGLRAQVPR